VATQLLLIVRTFSSLFSFCYRDVATAAQHALSGHPSQQPVADNSSPDNMATDLSSQSLIPGHTERNNIINNYDNRAMSESVSQELMQLHSSRHTGDSEKKRNSTDLPSRYTNGESYRTNGECRKNGRHKSGTKGATDPIPTPCLDDIAQWHKGHRQTLDNSSVVRPLIGNTPDDSKVNHHWKTDHMSV